LPPDPRSPRSIQESIRAFLSAGPWAVVGASTDRAKYGNKVLRCYQQHGMTPLYAVNPRALEVEGLRAHPELGALPELPRGVSIITPPPVTEAIVEEAVRLGIPRLWMQPGAESRRALALAEDNGIDCIAGGPCLLVALGFRE
jgi:predicted CoA-binding protein